MVDGCRGPRRDRCLGHVPHAEQPRLERARSARAGRGRRARDARPSRRARPGPRTIRRQAHDGRRRGALRREHAAQPRRAGAGGAGHPRSRGRSATRARCASRRRPTTSSRPARRLGGRVDDLVLRAPSRSSTGSRSCGWRRTATRCASSASRAGELVEHDTDVIVNATGFRPNLDMLREIRLELDDIVEAPKRLAPLIDPNVHSCGTVEPHGFAELRAARGRLLPRRHEELRPRADIPARDRLRAGALDRRVARRRRRGGPGAAHAARDRSVLDRPRLRSAAAARDDAIRAMRADDWPAVEASSPRASPPATRPSSRRPRRGRPFDAGKVRDAAAGRGRRTIASSGWAAASPVSSRAAYRGRDRALRLRRSAAHRAEASDARCSSAFIAAADAAGFWTIQSSVFPENAASLALHERAGFRVIGRREAIARSRRSVRTQGSGVTRCSSSAEAPSRALSHARVERLLAVIMPPDA